MQTVQLKVSLSMQLQNYLRSKSEKLGLTMSSYVKNLVVNDVKDIAYPSYQASTKTQEAYKQAKQEEAKNKLVEASDLDDFFQQL